MLGGVRNSIVTLAVLAAGLQSGPALAQGPSEIKIAIVQFLSGAAAPHDLSAVNTAKLLTEQFNAMGGIAGVTKSLDALLPVLYLRGASTDTGRSSHPAAFTGGVLFNNHVPAPRAPMLSPDCAPVTPVKVTVLAPPNLGLKLGFQTTALLLPLRMNGPSRPKFRAEAPV